MASVGPAAQDGPGGPLRPGDEIVGMRDFGIEAPSYLGISVESAVAVQVDFSLRGL